MSIYLTCQICSKKHTNFRALAQHVSLHKHTSQSYYDAFIKKDEDGICSCGKPTLWYGISSGYSKMCHSCSKKISAHKQWNSERGDERKRELSESLKGNSFSEGRPKGSKNKKEYPMNSLYVIERLKNNKMPSWQGKNHSDETKTKMSNSAYKRIEEIGLPRVSYKGRFIPQNPKKYKGDPTRIVYRSSWELKVMKHLDSNPNVIEWSSEEIIVPYFDPVQNKKRRYFPDFVIKVKRTDGSIHTMMLEVKPKAQTVEPKKQSKKTKRYITEVTTWATNEAKWKSAKEMCLDRGWEFRLITEDELGIK
jgi:hypothetical protein